MAIVSRYSLGKLLHPYYITNLVLAFIYLLLRLVNPMCSSLFSSCDLQYRESEILFFTAVIVVFRTRKQGSLYLLPYVSTACMFAKLASIVLFFYHDPIYGVVYMTLCLIHLLVLPEPSYAGPENVVYFTGEDMDEEIKGPVGTVWLVEFYTTWNNSSISFASDFSELSAKYSLPNFKFGKVDVARAPTLATKYRINTSFFTKQLPTLILFKDGREVIRRPLVGDNLKLLPFNFNYENVVATFDLNNVHEECKKRVPDKSKDKKKD